MIVCVCEAGFNPAGMDGDYFIQRCKGTTKKATLQDTRLHKRNSLHVDCMQTALILLTYEIPDELSS